MLWSFFRVSALALVLLGTAACNKVPAFVEGASNGAATTTQSPPDTTGSDESSETALVWDEGEWDQDNWQ